MIALRNYQTETLTAIENAHQNGLTRLLVALPTGTGKTIVFAELARRLKRQALILAHRDELIKQAADKVHMVWPEARIGIVKGKDDDWHDKDVVCASVQTLGRKRRLARVIDENFGLLVVDECFVAGTLIDGCPIELIKIGDYITSWDKKSNRFLKSEVTYVFKTKAPDKLVKIKASGVEFVCTTNHPILVNGKWCKASELKTGDILIKNKGINNDNIEIFHSIHMFRMSENFRKRYKKQKRLFQRNGKGLLFKKMCKGSIKKIKFKNYGNNKSQICIGENEKKESNEKSYIESQDDFYAQINRAQTYNAGRKRKGPYSSSKKISSIFGMGNGKDCPNKSQKDQFNAFFNSLQIRHSKQRIENRDRGRRRFSRSNKKTESGYKENYFFEFVRVDNIEIFEQGSDGEFERLCSDGFVYNLEVKGAQTYTANGIVVHNCHHSRAKTYENVIKTLGFDGNNHEKLLLGVTATPERQDGKGLGVIYQKIVYSVSLLTMIKANFLSDIRGYRAQTDADLSMVGTRHGDYIESQLAQAVNTPERNDLVVNSYFEHSYGRKGIAFCADVQHAKNLAEVFHKNGIVAKSLDGTTPKDERVETLQAFSRGEIEILTNCALFTEGFDEPSIECILMCRPTKSKVFYAQCIGRGTRRYPEKPDCIVIDFCDNRHDICSLPELLGWDKDKLTDGKSITEEIRIKDEEQKRKKYNQLSFDLPPVQIAEFDLLNKSSFRWVYDSQQWLLPVSPGVQATLIPNGDEKFNAFVIYKDQQGNKISIKKLHDVPLDLSYGQGVCEDFLRRNKSGIFSKKNATWRKNPASEKQISLLKRLKCYQEGITKGDATDIIEAFFAKKNANKIRQLVERN